MRDPRIIPIAREIRSSSKTNDEFILNALNYVHSNIQYIDDKKNQGQDEYVQMPMETLNLKKGDCEYMAILLLSILWAGGELNSKEVLGYVDMSHRWVEAKTSKGWYILDATNGNAIPVNSKTRKRYKAFWYITPVSIQSTKIPLPPFPLLI